MAKPKYKQIRVDELWPGDLLVTPIGTLRVLDVCSIKMDPLEALVGIGPFVCVEVAGETADDRIYHVDELVEVFPKPVVRPQPNFSVD
jgi:hypothetical protein